MALPARLVRELLVMVKLDASRRRGGSEQRRAPRVGMREPTVIVPVDGTREPVRCWVKNLSGTGVGLVARDAGVELGGEFVLQFYREGGVPPLRLLYRATHAARVASGLFAIGGRLVCVVEEVGVRVKRRNAS